MAKGTTEGWVYAIGHPAYPGWLKVGYTNNPDRRLAQYQTCDPFRAYEYVLLVRAENARATEAHILGHLSQMGFEQAGEWFLVGRAAAQSAFQKATEKEI